MRNVSDRLLNRVARELVGRLHLPPSFCGYRYFRRTFPSQFDYEVIHPPVLKRNPLPRNVADRDALNRDNSGWGFSFYDVPERMVTQTAIATIPNCRILAVPDEWGDRHYAIFTGGRLLQLRGTSSDARFHPQVLKQLPPNPMRIKRAAWILEQWDRNWAHWLQWHLTKIVLLHRRDPELKIIMPGSHRFASVQRSVQLLGVDPDCLVPMSTNVLDVDELVVLEIDDYRDVLLHDLRDALLRDPDPKRKIFMSRTKADWRRLVNEEECWDVLRTRGFERVFMEDLDFDQQLALMRETAVLLSVHGSGMANMIFAPPGLRVIEIYDATFPNPQFYALAATLGHPYWIVESRPSGELRPGYHDISVDPNELAAVLDDVSAAGRTAAPTTESPRR
jgi:capsular polysaccharide biosynthesis protein